MTLQPEAIPNHDIPVNIFSTDCAGALSTSRLAVADSIQYLTCEPPSESSVGAPGIKRYYSPTVSLERNIRHGSHPCLQPQSSNKQGKGDCKPLISTIQTS